MWKFINEIIDNLSELTTFIILNIEVSKNLLSKSSNVMLVSKLTLRFLK